MFNNAKEGEIVYGLVYGEGIIATVYDDGFYKFEVEYKNHQRVPYDEQGVPGWANFEYQTVFYPKDVEISKFDNSPSTEVLTPKEIITLRRNNRLEIKCPSGLWSELDKCPGSVIEEYLENNMLHLFRKK